MPARSVNERLLKRTIGHHVGIQRLAAGAVNSVLDRLRVSDTEIINAITAQAISDGTVTPARVDRLLTTIRTSNTRAYREIGQELSYVLNELADYEVNFNSDLLDTILPIAWKVISPKKKMIRAIVDEEPMHGGLFSEWIEGMAVGRYTRIRAAIRLGVTNHESYNKIIRRLRGVRQTNHRDGVFSLSHRSAMQVTNTLHNHVANQAKLSVARANKGLVRKVLYVATLDDVTCPECQSWDGEVFDSFGVAPTPPLHLNCRCNLVLMTGDWSDYVEMAETTPTIRETMNGKVPAKLKYSEWLEDQTAEVQEDILGKDRAAMFRRGFPIKKFVDHMGRRYSLKQLKSIEDKQVQSKSRYIPLTVVKRRNYGWQPDLPDQRDHLFAVTEPKEVALPVRVSLRDKMPPVFNQGSLGSCTANAIIAAAMYAFGADCPMLSRLDLYYKERVLEDTIDEDSGAEIRDGIKALARWGVATESTWPYKVRAFNKAPPEEAGKEDDHYKIKSYSRLKGHEDFMKALTMGYPFVGGFSVYENFDDPLNDKFGILPMPTVDQKMLGGHAVLFVGYDSEFHSNEVFKNSGLQTSQVPALMYECRNSFGPDWGDDGYFWMPAPYVEDRDLSDDFWMIKA